VITARPGLVEVAAGPGTQPPPVDQVVVEKPVMYVHATQSTEFSLRVDLGPGYTLAERWPGSAALIAWRVAAAPEPCPARGHYPSTCTSVDGYCESGELGLYEASGSSCLLVGATSSPDSG